MRSLIDEKLYNIQNIKDFSQTNTFASRDFLSFFKYFLLFYWNFFDSFSGIKIGIIEQDF